MGPIEPLELRSRGEAHLYIAVAKADGIVSSSEWNKAPYEAKKSQKIMNILKCNEAIRKRISDDVYSIFQNPDFKNWTANRHLDHAVSLLSQAKESGEWAVQLIADKNEEGLYNLAILDGYTIQESKFLAEIKNRLSEFK